MKAILCAVLAFGLFLGARALWFNGFDAGTDSAECLDLFTLVGDSAAAYDVCQRAKHRYEHDLLARVFATDAELKLRREAARGGL